MNTIKQTSSAARPELSTKVTSSGYPGGGGQMLSLPQQRATRDGVVDRRLDRFAELGAGRFEPQRPRNRLDDLIVGGAEIDPNLVFFGPLSSSSAVGSFVSRSDCGARKPVTYQRDGGRIRRSSCGPAAASDEAG
jgi:hypothetical protein